jgi:hypothetical protein
MVLLAPALRSAQWELMPGAGGVSWVKHGAHVLMLSSGLAAWCWALAAAQSVWPLLLASAWTWQLITMWRKWAGSPRNILLQWRGPPASIWCVPAWGDSPVSARCVWDGQATWLLHLRSQDGLRQAWLWVRDDGENDKHRLRTLLNLP